MLAGEFIGKVVIKFRGKPANKAPQPGSPKFEMYLSLANDLLADWAKTPGYNWRTLRQEYGALVQDGRVVLPDDYLRLTDNDITIDGKPVEYLAYEDRNRTSGVYESGHSPTVLKLTNGDSYEGKVLECSIITHPPKLVNAASEVVCDSLEWLITATAAAIAMNDPAKSDVYPDLAGEANAQFAAMSKASRQRPSGMVRRVPRKATRVGGIR